MERTITTGKYTITYSYDPANEYRDNLTITERDAFAGGRLIASDTTSRYEPQIDAEWIETANTRELIELALFGQWTFGYPYVGIGEGFMLCQECALNELVTMADDPDMHSEQDWVTVTILQERRPAGEHCENGCVICEPFCEECGNESAPLLYSDSGYHAICRDCMASQLVTGTASRTVISLDYNRNGAYRVEYRNSNASYSYVRS